MKIINNKQTTTAYAKLFFMGPGKHENYLYIYAFFESYISAELSSGSTCKWSGLDFSREEKCRK